MQLAIRGFQLMPEMRIFAGIPDEAKGEALVLLTARDELIRGVRGMTGRTLRIETGAPNEPAIVVGTGNLAPDAFTLKIAGRNTTITGGSDRGALYGVFAYLRKIALGEPLAALNETQTPRVPTRWVNEWNNLDGTIERGYGGRSIFWEEGKAREDLSRVNDYGRLLASLGINGCSINNVNVNPRVLAPDFLPQVKRIAERTVDLAQRRFKRLLAVHIALLFYNPDCRTHCLAPSLFHLAGAAATLVNSTHFVLISQP
jgi:alpha-glucuronidase